ncbi:GFA family protein [Ilumatobacter nonamiensis]|uniref:GFA family protein n=1 Tax=Ilumatobacter nonamiensis TaxID=467093 RepID=UPI00058DEFC4|nr:GFA family protein [Ilumatobacter nonamiensis]
MSVTGRCLCGEVSYEVTGDIVATAVCHCDHCQRQSGGAFSVNIVAHASQLNVTGTLVTYGDRGDDGGDTVHVERRFCGTCGSPIVSELMGTDGVIAVKAGSLDDKSAVKPNVEVWCEHRQPWVDLPGMDVSIDRE